ncbi:MAG: histidine kinase dimerization/phosphoacceptor domain -containing protein [Microcoleaceae cyanobacterium]
MPASAKVLVVATDSQSESELGEQLTALGYEVIHLPCSRVDSSQASSLVVADVVLIDRTSQTRLPENFQDDYRLPVVSLKETSPQNAESESTVCLEKPIHPRELGLAIELALSQKQTTELRATEGRLRSMIETINEIIWEVDSNLIFTYISPRIQDILGHSVTDFLGRSCLDLLVPQGKESYTTIIQSFLRMQQPINNLEHVCIHRSSYRIPVETSSTPLFDDQEKFQGYRGITRDISERQRVQEALLSSAATNRALINAIPDLIFRIGQEDRFVNYKASHQQDLLPFISEEFLGRRVDQILPEDLAQPILKSVHLAMETNQLQTFEYQLELEELRVWEFRVFVSADDEVMVLVRDISDRKQAEAELRMSLQEKEMLVREVHHRVKNNLQVISSIFSLQSQATDDPDVLSLLDESQDRIRSMALIHEQLYQSSGLGQINLQDYIKSLTHNLLNSYRLGCSSIDFYLDVEPIDLNLDTAIPCGLLINELVSNALKHGFVGRKSGEVMIKIHKLTLEAQQLCLIVQDNGVGLPANFDIGRSSSLGFRLIRALTRQLKGELEMYNHSGAVFKITFFQLD